MIWTRRTFLKTILGSIAAAVAPAIPFTPAEPVALASPAAPEFTPFNPDRQFWVYDIIATVDQPAGLANEPVHLSLTRRGQFVLQVAMHPATTFRWVAPPGHEIAGQGLLNQSSADLRVVMHVEQDGNHYHFGDGEYVPLGVQPATYAHDDEYWMLGDEYDEYDESGIA